MTLLPTFSFRFLAIFVPLTAANLAWANPASCNPPPSPNYTLGTGANGLAAGGTFASGCEQINLLFTGFAISSGTIAGSDINVSFGGTTELGGLTSAFNSSAFSGGGVYSSSADFDATVDAAVLPPATGTAWFVTTLLVNLSGTTAPNISSLELAGATLEFCVGSTTFDCTNQSANYGQVGVSAQGFNGSLGFFDESCFNDGATGASAPCTATFSNGTSTTSSLTIGTGSQQIAFREFFGGQVSTLGTVTDTFVQTAETPEPSSLLLCGFTMFVATLVRRRYKLKRT